MNPFKNKTTKAGDFEDAEIPDLDTHHGILVAIIDLGTHDSGKYGSHRQCVLIWELTEAQNSAGNNFYVYKRYTLSFNEKALLRKALEDWKRIKYADGVEPDVTEMLGKPWAVEILHDKRTKEGKERVYANVGKVGPVKKGVKVAAAKCPDEPFCYFIDPECDMPVPEQEWLPRVYGDLIADLIKTSPEYTQMQDGEEGEVPAGVVRNGSGEDDDIPY